MNFQEIDLKCRIQRVRDLIRKKFGILKRQRTDAEREFGDTYRRIKELLTGIMTKMGDDGSSATIQSRKIEQNKEARGEQKKKKNMVARRLDSDGESSESENIKRDINGIVANIIPSVVKTMVLELVRENDKLISDLKTRFDSFTPQVVNIQREILTKIPNSIKIAVEESTKERDIIIGDFKAQLYNLNKPIELLDEVGGEGESENKRPKPT
ncbi:hypothetical protein FQA39_LY15984 [Lamprigera yunnana]|nr:hypothetical protein FQA39_LY15984 [Lamprigera yunnana]